MADRLTIMAEPRSVTGKKVKRLRRDGWIPAVIYGQGDPTHIQIENIPLRRVLRVSGTSDLFDIAVGDNKHTVLVREIQRHLTRGDLLHLDFLEVDMKVKVTTDARLVTVGQAAPAAAGLGAAQLLLYSVDIECLPDALVSEIKVDLSLIQEGSDLIYVRDLAIPEGVTILTDDDALVARFAFTRVLDETEEEEEELFEPAADSVEVISKGKEEDEDES